MISLERCIYFINVEPESGYHKLDVLEKKLRKNKKIKTRKVNKEWPSQGSYSIQNLKIKYREDLDYVIKDLSLEIPACTKVGIVGRTGAGKTTFLSALYRNFGSYEGKIMLDGKDISKIDLKELRFNMTIIPQDAHLLADTVHNNLDPTRVKSEQDAINVLKDVDLWEKLEGEGGLGFMIDKNGQNLSQGEKQLFCLARAMLRRSKVILMDEATANIDSVTEKKIQNILTEKFTECTIIMIAHRLNTILHCDK